MSSNSRNSQPHDAVPGHNAKSGAGALHHAAGAKGGDAALIALGYVPVRQLFGKVVGVWGDAHIRHLDGSVSELHVGYVVKKGEVVLTSQDGIVQIEPHPRTQLATAGDDVERVISQVGRGDADVVPAAGPNAGGAAGSLEEGLRVGRDSESVTPAGLVATGAGDGAAGALHAQAVAPILSAPIANPDSESTAANTPITFDPRGNDSSTSVVTITAIAGQPISPGATVTLPQGTVTMNADGTLTFAPLPGASGSVTFTYTESNGSASTATSTITVDVAAPPAPPASVGLQHDTANDTGASPTDNLTANPHPVLAGTGAPNASVTVTVTPPGGTAVTYTATTDASGHWTLDTATATPSSGALPAGGLPDGTVALSVTTTDAAGHSTTATGSFVEDRTPPATSIGLVHDAANDTGASGTDSLTSNPKPVLAGTGEPNASVSVTLTTAGGATITYTATTDASGHWTLDTASATPTSGTMPAAGLPDGTVGLSVTSTDAAGNTSTATGSFTEDHTPPAATVGLQHDAGNDTGASATDGITSNTRPVLTGTGEANSTVTVTVTPASGAPITYTATTDASGHWAIDTATATPSSGTLPAAGLPDGPVGLTATSTDAAGNTITATGSFTEDLAAPTASIGLKHDVANDTGASSTDSLTGNGKPVLEGTGEPGSTVTITVRPTSGAPITYTASTDASGHWSLDTAAATPTSGTMPASGLPDGTVGLSVTTTDAAGNTTTASGSFVEDSTAPAASIGLQHDAASDTGASSTDNLTANAKPVLTGTGEANSTVTVTVTPASGGAITYAATTDATGAWSIDMATATPSSGTLPAAGLPDGTVGLQVVSTDAAGNSSSATSSFVEDHGAPVATIGLQHDATSDTGASATDSLTSNVKPVLTGTGEANSTVTITVTPASGSPITYTATTDASGAWSLDTATATPTSGTMPAAGLPDGAVGLSVTSTDAAGNTSTATSSFTEDHTAPTASIGLKHDAADDTGTSATDNLTANGKPVLTGTGEANSTVTVTVTPATGSPITYTAGTDASGAWSIDTSTATPTSGTMPAAGLPDGAVGLSVTSTDAAGNTSTATSSFTEDRTAPTAAIGLQHDAANDTGASSTDNLTANAKPVLTGTGEANSTVTITVTPASGAPIIYTATTDASGAWSLDTATATPTLGTMPAAGLPDGAVGLSVTSTDAAGNTSTATSSFTEDHTAPTAAIGLQHDAANDTGASSTDNLTANTKPILTGTGEANSTVTVTVTPSAGGAITYTATTDATGAWSLNTATATPTSGTMPASGLPDGAVSLKVVSTDAAGNSTTATGSFTEDHTAPTATIGLQHDAANDTGASSTDNLTANAKPVLTGTGEANSTVTITVTPSSGSPITYTATTDGSGNWSVDLASATPASGSLPSGGLVDGTVGLKVVSTDAAGNSSTATGSFVEDHTAPTTSIGLQHDAANDTGSSATDNLTSNAKPILVGTGEANSTVTITITPASGGAITYTATTDASGAWSLNTATATPTSGTLPASGLVDGTVGLNVVSTDAAGNSASSTSSFVEDHTAPAASIGLKHDATDDTGTSSTDNLTANAKPILTGTGEANSTVTVTVTPSSGSPITYTATTDASGAWSLDTATATPTSGTMPASGLPDGAVGLSVTSTDAAGNTSTAASSFTEDHTAPTATIGLQHDAANDTGASSIDNLTANAKPVLTGTGEANSTVTITVTPASGSPITYTATTDASGAWSLDTATATPTSGTMPAGGLPDGTVGLQVVSTDGAGNSTTATGSFVEDHTAPVASIDLRHDGVNDTGSSPSDGVTANTQPVIVGTGEANAQVNVSVTAPGGVTLTYVATTDSSGKWSLDLATATPVTGTMPAGGLPDGTIALQVSSTDAAGNTATSAGSFIVSHSMPGASIDLVHDAADDTGASTTDGITRNTSPVIAGTGAPSSVVHVTVTDSAGHALTYDATTDASGQWSIDTATATPTSGSLPAGGFADGAVALKVLTTDSVGNTATGTGSFTVDHTAPTAAIGLQHDAANDSGTSATDNLTANVKPVLTGTGEANSTVTVTVTPSSGSPITYTATTDASGAWSLDTATATPTSGTMPASGLPDGAVGLSVTSTDAAGNTSTATSSFTEDHTAPTAAIGLQHDAANDTGASSTDNLTANAKPVLTGTGEANSTVTITVTPSSGSPITYTATTDGSGNWSVDLASATPTSGTMPAAGLPDGAVGLSVTSTDAAGNTSTATSSFNEDHTAPTASIGLKHDAADDSGTSATDNLTANPKPILTGTGEANSTVTVTVTPSSGSPITYTATTDASGAWSLDTATATPTSGTMPASGLPDGAVGLSVTSTDAAGNTSTAASSFTEDHTAPTATIGLQHDAANDTGASSIDNLTANAKPVLTGTGEANSTVTITVTPASGSPITYTATTDASGAWSLDTATATPTSGTMPAGGLPDGTVGLQVVSTDGAGNSTTATGSFVEDHTAPVASIDLRHDGVNDTGSSPSDGVTANTQPVIVGTGEANAQVNVSVTAPGGVTLTYVATTDSSGKWSLDLATATPVTGTMPAGGLPDGTIALQVSSTDAAGNTATSAGSFIVSHSMPGASIDLVHDAADDTGASTTDGITRNTSPVIAGTGAPSSVVHVTVTDSAGHALTYDATTDASGQWSIDTATATPTSGSLPAGGFADGAVALKVLTTDSVGNTATGTGSFTVDHTAPTAAIGLQHDAANDSGTSATDNLTANVKPVLTGTGEANSTVTVTVTPSSGSPITYTATTDASGAWSLDTATATPTSGTMPASGLPDGAVGLSVTSTDAAGNTSTATSSFTEDHTAPTAAIGLQHDAANDTGASSTDNLTANAKPVLTGTGEANSTVTITVTPSSGSPITYTATTDGSGNWSVDLASATPASGSLPSGGLVDGTVGLKVVSTDAAGNSSTATGSFVEDHTSPTTSIGLQHDAANDTGSSATDDLTSNAKPILVGTGEANSTVTITITPASGGTITYTATTDATGAWSLNTATATPTSGTLPASGLVDGTVGLNVVSTDAAGNSASSTSSFVEDHTAPAASIGLKHDAADDTGTSATDNLTANTKPFLAGTGEANSTVTVTVTPSSGSPITYTATTDASGAWSLDTASATPTSGTMPAAGLPDGAVGLSVTSTDAAGNTSTATSSFTEDQTAPTTSIGLQHDAINDTGTSATDSLTANAKPVLTGTGEANSTVTITVTPSSGSPITYTATTDASGAWSLDTATATPTSGTMPASGLPDGTVGLSVTSTDAAGNTSTATSSFTEDQTAPTTSIGLQHDAINDTGTSATDNLTANAKPILTGTGEANSTVTVTVTPSSGSPITYTATTDASGAWSLDTASATPTSGTMPAAGLPDGAVGLSVTSTDAAGNTSTATSSFTEDQTAPTTSIGLQHDAINDTGTSATDNLTANAKPVLTGTGEANSTVTITVTPSSGSPITYTATTDASGAWSLDTATATPTSGTMPAAGLPDGAVGLSVTSTDAAGNTSTATSSFTEDHTAPTAAIGLQHDAANDTGASSTDNLTANAKPVLTGTGEANSTVTITVTPASGAPITYTASTDASGHWSLDTAAATPTSGTMPASGLPDGTVGLSVTTTDAAGNTTTASGSFVEDSTAPAASIGLQHDAASDTGASSTDNLTANAKPVLTGTGEANSTVTVTVTPASGGAITYAATTDATGAWSIDMATATPSSGTLPAAGLPDGTVGLQVVSTDAAGNSSSATSSFVEDHTAPVATIGLQHDATSDTGASATDSLTSNVKPVLTGTGEANSTVTITVTPSSGSPITYTATTDASGAWSLDTATATPTSGTMPAAGLPDGAVGLSVTSTDAAGNTSTATSSFTEDHTAPTAAIGLQHDAANDTGASSTDNLTANAKPVLTGTGEANSTVTITVTPSSGSPITYTATTDALGAWSLDTATATPTSGTMPAAGLPDGEVGLSVTSTDAAGNTSTATSSFTEDHTAPTAAIGLRHDAANDTGASSTDNLTANPKPVLTGTGEANSTVTITVTPSSGSPITYTATTDASGAWSLDTATATPTSGTMPASGLPDGAVGLSVTSTDAAGNTSTATSSFTEDHTAPTAAIGLQHDAINDTGTSATDNLTANAKPVLTGTGEANSTVTITVTPASGSPITYTATTDASGAWSLDTATATPTSGTMPASGLPDGTVGLSVTSTDAAGNTSTATSSFTEDHSAPTAAIGLRHDAINDTGTSATDNLTANAKPVLTGTGEANSTVTITVTPASGAPITYTATTDASGAWSLDTATATPTSGTMPAAGLPDGAVGLSVTSTDAAGNTSTATSSFTEDHTAPTATIGLQHDAANDTGASSTDNLTANTKPILTGTGEASSTVTVTVTPSSGGAITYTATTDATGAWSLNTATATPTSGTMPASGLPDGAVSLKVVSTDAAGNSKTATGSFTEDHTAPTATIGLKHDAINDTGTSATDNLTANVKPVLTGTGEANSTVTITVTPSSGSPITYTATTDGSGNWSVDLASATPASGSLPSGGLVDGTVGLKVVSTDAAGNSSTATGSFVEDHTAPTTSIGLQHDAANDTGSSATDNLTSNAKPILVGTGEANSSVTITITPASGGAITYTATTDATGAWSLNTATATPTSGTLPASGLVDGTVGLNVVSTDAAGNSASSTSSFVEDHTAPAASIGLKHDAADDTGTSATDNLTANAKPILTGTGEANSTVTVTVTPSSGSPITYTATTDASGAWSVDMSTATPTSGTLPSGGLVDGTVGLRVVSTDAAGNSTSATSSFVEDHTAPTASIGLKHDVADDTGASATDNITNNGKPVLTGTGEANATVTITVTPASGSSITYTATTDATGAWSLDTATATPTSGTMPASGLADGSVGLKVVSTDAAGNSTTATSTFTEDRSAPVATIDLKHDAADDTGVSSTDGITSNTRPVLTGKGEPSSTVVVTVSDSASHVVTYTTSTDASGAWSLDTNSATPTSGTLPASGFADGKVALTVVSTDIAGNSTTGTGSFTELHTGTAATIDLKHDAANDTGSSSTDGITANVHPVLTGTGPALTTVVITVTPPVGGPITYTATTDASGNWTLDTGSTLPTSGSMPLGGLPDGTVGLKVVGTDSAGNTSTGLGSFVEDHTAPKASISLQHDAANDTGASASDSLTSNAKPVLTGTGEPSSTVTVTVTPASGGVLTYTATTDASGVWSIDTSTATPTSGTMPAAGLPDGTVALKVVSTDVAGNSTTATGSLTEDHTAPTATIGLKHDAANDTGTSATDNLTGNAKPILTGTGEPSSTVTITVTPASGGAITYTAATNAAGAWSLDLSTATPTSGTLPASGLVDGAVGLKVVSTDAAGNSTTATGSFTEDHTAPTATIGLKHDAANDTGTSATDNLTANTKPILTGTGEANSTVTVTVTPSSGGAITYTATTDATGAWSLNTATATPTSGTMPASGLPDGAVSLKVVSTDAAGNSTTATSSFTEDHTAPAATIGLKHDATNDTGTSATDNLTANTKPILTGTGEASSTVTVTVTPSSGGAITYTATTDATGAWSLNTATATPTSGTMPASGLPDGAVSLKVVSTDAAGNSTTATGSFTEDHTAPTAAIGLQHDAANDTGASSTDNLTANAKPVLTGTGEANSTVTITVTPSSGSPITYTATTDGSGNWSVDLASATPASGSLPSGGLVDGTVGLKVVSTDAAGNSSTATGSFVEDHTAPTTSIGLQHDAANDTGSSATDNLTSNAKPILVGTGEANSTVTITITPASGGAITYTATTDASGAWSLNTATATPTSGTLPASGLVDGTVGLNVVSTDAAGNSASSTSSFVEDHTAPTASIGLKHDAADDTGTSATDNLTANTKPILTGTGEANSTVTITVTPASGGVLTYTATTDATGAWSIDTSTATPTSGTMPAAGLPDGAVSLKVVSTDAAGNSTTATGSFTEDHTAPTATIGLKHDAANDTGTSSTDNLTANAKPILTGTGEANSTVTITVTPASGGVLTYTATTDASGAWSIDTSTATPTSGTMPASGLPDGTVALKVVSTDAAGNSTTATGSFTEDHTAPTATIGLKHDAANDTGTSSTDNLTANAKPILTGTGEANSTVTITVTPASGGVLTYTATTDASGAWSIDTSTATPTSGTMPASGLPDGTVALKVVSTDAAGNSTTATGSFTEDHTAPVATIGLKHDATNDTGTSATDNLTANAKPILTGTGEANSTVTITVTPASGGVLTYTATTDASGAWSIDTSTATPTSGTMPAAGLPDGTVALKVVSTDAAGNSTTATGSFTEDHTAPTATIGLKHDAANDTGTSSTDNLTANAKPILTGTGEANSTVTITVTPASGGVLTYTATTDASGAWSIDTSTATPTSGTMPASGLPDGTVALKVVSTDAAGNSTTASGSFTEDHTAPVATIGLKHDATNDTGTSATDNLTANAKPILTGTGEANSTVTITVTPASGGVLTYTATTDATGAWSIDTSTATPTSGTMPAAGLPDGTVALKVVSTDAAGNSTTATGSFTEDHTAPTATIGLKHDAANDTGTSSTDNLTANAKPILTGTGEANSTVTITVTPASGGVLTYTATTDATGAWSIDTSTATPTSGTMPASGLPDGTVALKVVSTDAAGNSTTASGSFTEDHTAPVATIGLKHDATNDTGTSATDNLTANAKPILTGTGEANSTVTITVTPASGGVLTYTATTDATGAWSIDTSTATPTSGTMPASGLPDGTVALKVVSTDAAGNSTTATGSFTEDHTIGAPTIGLQHDAANDTGTSSTDNLTNNQKPVLTGTAEANSTVTVTVTPSSGGAITYTATTNASGTWSINLATATPTSGTLPASGLVDGAVALKVVATDAAGNVSVSGTGAFTEDHTAPLAAIGLKHDAANDTGTSATDSLTSNSVPVITGTGEKSSTVLVSVTDAGGHTLTYTAATDATGAWSIDLAAQAPTSGTMPRDGLSDGAVSLSVSSTDAAGNTATAAGTFTIDSVDHAATPTVSVAGVGRWQFDEGTGTSTTDAYNAYTGTLKNLNTAAGGTAPTWITGHNGTAGSALSFDGKGGVVAVPAGDTAALTGTSSLSVWFKTTQTGTTIGWSSPSIIGSESAGDGNDIQWGTLNNKGQIGLDVGNQTGVYSTAAVNDGNWHDMQITRTVNANGTSTVSIYIDGVLSNSGTIAADPSSPTGIVSNELAGFGYTNGWSSKTGDTTAGDVYYNGSLDDARIYNHVLTADQAKAIFTVENGYENQAVANDGDAIKLVVTDTNATALHLTGVEAGMTISDGTAAHTITSTGNTQSIDLTGWNLANLQLTNAGTGSANLQFDAINTTASGQTHDATTWISVSNGTSLLGGTTGNDTLNASAQTQAMFISGQAGNDSITGGSGNDRLLGGAGNDTISGGAGNDLIVGGTGNNTLTGGAGNDVFRWEFGDHGTAGSPNVDIITDFSSAAGNKDVLDLRDLLTGANHDGTQPGNIANYLHFELSGGDTVIHVSSSGGFSNGYVASAEDETIVLKGIDLTSANTQNDLQIIHQLLSNGQVHLG